MKNDSASSMPLEETTCRRSYLVVMKDLEQIHRATFKNAYLESDALVG